MIIDGLMDDNDVQNAMSNLHPLLDLWCNYMMDDMIFSEGFQEEWKDVGCKPPISKNITQDMEYKISDMCSSETKKEYDFECSKIMSHNISECYKANKSKFPALSGLPSFEILDNSIDTPPSNDDSNSNAVSSKYLTSVPAKFSCFIQILQTIFEIPTLDAEWDIVRL